MLLSLDHHIFTWIVAHRWSPLDPLMLGLSAIGQGGRIWLLFALVAAVIRRLTVRGALSVALAVLLASFTTNWVLKPIVKRQRPFVRWGDVQLLDRSPSGYSFPSGHSANAFAGAFVLSRLARASSVPWWILAAAIAYSRIYLGVHYPLDVIGGAVVGIACGVLALKIGARPPR